MSDDTNPVGDFTVTDPGAPAHMGVVEAAVQHMKDWVRAEFARMNTPAPINVPEPVEAPPAEQQADNG